MRNRNETKGQKVNNMMELKKVNSKLVESQNCICTRDEFELGVYKVAFECYVSKDGSYSWTQAKVNVSYKDMVENYIPEIVFNSDFLTGANASFTIQTTAFGEKSPEEIKLIVDGYEYAIEAVEVLTREFLGE